MSNNKEAEAKALAAEKKAKAEAAEKAAAKKAAEKAAAEALDPGRAEESAPEAEEAGAFKAVYRELLENGTRKGPIAYKDFKTKKEAEEFAENTGGKLV